MVLCQSKYFSVSNKRHHCFIFARITKLRWNKWTNVIENSILIYSSSLKTRIYQNYKSKRLIETLYVWACSRISAENECESLSQYPNGCELDNIKPALNLRWFHDAAKQSTPCSLHMLGKLCLLMLKVIAWPTKLLLKVAWRDIFCL